MESTTATTTTTANNNNNSSSNNNNNNTISNSNNSMNNSIMEPNPIDLYEFLVESELQHYYNSIKTELKIIHVTHLKYATDEDFRQIGLSKPEIRRLRKFYDKYYPHGYLSKIRRLLQNPTIKRDDATVNNTTIQSEPLKVVNSPSKMPNNKHIIPADSICVNKQLGIGEFGIVQQGVWTNGTERIQVAIKCLCRDRMQSNPMEFLKEAAIMHSIEHENIVRLYGVVLDTESLMLVTELAHLRSLLECLKDSGLRVNFLTVSTLCEFAMQICNGMMYLENKRLIHRDLAARNILVFSKNKVKISDFGLSRALGVGKDYYQTNFNVNLKLPIAWCAPECINFLRFTNASDVWAYGVCLWEMFSYGFQPWAALTGHQILEAIDEPNYQRLEQPECCPKDYYSSLMLKCWQHDPLKRPKFHEIYSMLPDMKPEQLKTISGFSEIKKDHLMYRQNDLITVLDKSSNSPYWKGVLNTGKTGLFNPVNTVTYLGSLPSSTNRDSLYRTTERSSKRKLRTEMISRPQNDFKHTGHVGLDGAYFGDVSFLSNQQNYNHVPRQVVTPYKPSEDIEQTPLLLPPTPTSPDSLQTASGYFAEGITASTNHSFINHSNELNSNSLGNIQLNNFTSAFDFQSAASPIMGGGVTEFNASNPFAMITGQSTENGTGGGGILLRQHLSSTSADDASGSFTNTNLEVEGFYKKTINWSDEEQRLGGVKGSTDSNDGNHEYHEISDDELPGDKVFDLGPSLLEEISYTLRGMNTNNNVVVIDQQEPKSPDFDNTNKKNEMTELSAMLNKKSVGSGGGGSGIVSGTLTNSKNKKKPSGSVKHISVKDEKILNQAINFANEISAKSMTDLVAETPVAQSPKRKFSFRFPNLTNHGNGGGHGGHGANGNDKDHNSMGGGGIASGGGGGCGGSGGGNGSCASGNGNNNGLQSNSNTLTYTNNNRTRNFSEEIKNVPDLQNSLTEECREAYNSLVEKPSAAMGRYDYEKTKIDHLEQLMEKRLAIAAAAAATTAAATSAAVTLPRKSTLGSQAIGNTIGGGSSTIHKFKDLSNDRERLTPPPPPPGQSSQSSSTAKHNLESTVVDSNPLRILRDKNYPIVRPRVKAASGINGENIENSNVVTTSNGNRNSSSDLNGDQQQQQQHQCESPSYLQNNEYTFNERDVNLYRGGSQKFIGQKEVDTLLNTVPLPPRDRNKPIQTNMKRHVRKHPLIMTGTGVQRTLNKVNETGNDCELTITTVDPSIQVPTGIAPSIPKQTDENNYNTKQLTKPVTQISKLKGLTTDSNQIPNYNQQNHNHHSYMNQQDAMNNNNNNHNISSPKIISQIKNDNLTKKTIDINNIYQNIQPTNSPNQSALSIINTPTQITDIDFDDDTASLHFESILEGEKVCEMSSPDVTDGHFMFDIGKDDQMMSIIGNDYRPHQQHQQQSSLDESNSNNNNNRIQIVNTQKIPADIIERKKLEFSKKYPKYLQPKNELANNVLFNKIKETVELQDDTDGGTVIKTNTSAVAATADGGISIESSLTGSGNTIGIITIEGNTIQTTTTTTTKLKPQLTIDIPGANNNNNNASGTRNRQSIKSNELFNIQQQLKQTPDAEQQKQPIDNNGNVDADGDGTDNPVGGSFIVIEHNDKSSSSSSSYAAALTKDSNSVSCEDLLEFSDKKPKGRERGIESDEVRIMLKVLGKDVAPEQCMFALEAIDWDVHKAIKLVKLQNSLSACNLMYEECIEVLIKYDWDLQTAVQKLRY